MISATLLRQARRAHGLSQRALARRARRPQPRVAEIEAGRHDPSTGNLERLLSPLGWRLAVLPTRRRTAAGAADDVAEALRRGDDRAAYRHLLQLHDDLAHEHGVVRVALVAAPPALTGDARYDAFLAALVEHHMAVERLPVPEWTAEPARFARPAWFVVDLPAFRAEAWSTTPAAFARHGVFVGEAELASV